MKMNIIRFCSADIEANYFTYVFWGIGDNLTILNEYKLTPSGADHLLLFLIVSSNSPIVRIQDQSDASQYVCYLCFFYVTIRSFVLKGSTLFIFSDERLRIQYLHLGKSVIFDITRYKAVRISLNSREILEGILKIIRPQI